MQPETTSTVEISAELLQDLIDVCSWYDTACNLSRNGETYETCPDQQAFNYLQSEARGVRSRAEVAMKSAKVRKSFSSLEEMIADAQERQDWPELARLQTIQQMRDEQS